MNPIPIKKLYNPQYDLLSTSDRMELLNKIGKIYNLELICFKEFTAFGKSTYTADIHHDVARLRRQALRRKQRAPDGGDGNRQRTVRQAKAQQA